MAETYSTGVRDRREQARVDDLLSVQDQFGRIAPDEYYKRIQRGTGRFSFFNQIFKARQEGKLSENTFQELAFDLTSNLRPVTSDLINKFKGEVEGSSKDGRSRLATQKMFQLMQDRPGRTQTLLAPRSNSSKSILGV